MPIISEAIQSYFDLYHKSHKDSNYNKKKLKKKNKKHAETDRYYENRISLKSNDGQRLLSK